MYLPTVIILIGYSIFSFIYTFKNKKAKIESNLFLNEILIALLFFVSGILFPFIYQAHSLTLNQASLNFLWLFTSAFLIMEIGGLLVMFLYNGIISIRNPEIMAERDYAKYCEEFNKNWKDDLKSELGRKILHLFSSFIIFFFWTLSLILNDLGILTQLGLDTYSFAYWLTVTIGLGFVVMFQIGDLTRLNRFYFLPKWSKIWYKSMRQKEQNTFLASTPLVLSFIPFLFAPFPIFGAVVLITTGADAAACVIGKKFGKHSLRKNSNKTIEGFIAGGLSTFLIVVIISLLYHQWMPVPIEEILVMATVATILFLLIDLLARNISDNILNPLICGFGIWIIFLL